jgi:DNA invertase Pin-like site-specific DNA recombinase
MLFWRMPMSTETESGAPLRCAIYARKSTDEQAASTRVQVEEAGRFVQERGWLLEPGQVFIEDARSRAEFKNRPELFRMIDAAKAGHFEVLVVRDESRLGGDMLRTGLIIQDLVEHGVRLFHYATGEEVRFDDATSQLVVTIRNFAAQMEREKTASRTYEHLQAKARKGHNAGGRVFGYRNVEVRATGPTGDEVRLRTEYEIDPEQAAVVRRIFELYAAGEGYRGITRILNDEGVAAPRAGRRGSGTWGPTTIRSMILNERYRGFVPWNRYQKTYRGGTKVRHRAPGGSVDEDADAAPPDRLGRALAGGPGEAARAGEVPGGEEASWASAEVPPERHPSVRGLWGADAVDDDPPGQAERPRLHLRLASEPRQERLHQQQVPAHGHHGRRGDQGRARVPA